MKSSFKHSFIFVMGLCLLIAACNNKSETDESTTTDTAKAETNQPGTPPSVPDAVAADPAHNKLLADSMGIKVIEANYAPGDSSVMHSHHDYVNYLVESGGSSTFVAEDGTKTERSMPAGALGIRAAENHSLKNTGTKAVKAIVFEINRSRNPMSWDATLDATKVAPNQYKLAKDSLGIRAIHVSFKPGDNAGMHAHPDAALYVIEPSTAEFTGKDGKKHTVEMKKGMVLIVPAEAHSVKNIGKTTMKGVLVEVNRSVN